ncbi:MAG TPA: type II toxin-antitoxin system RelE/ParE family toxin [Anaerolineae bacterium]|nr:type II toxin-antitoxin system RelE/ParE family toxin [Anaerolineae bacterium]
MWKRSSAHNATNASCRGRTNELRVGDYRVVYEQLHEEHVIVVHMIGHRGEIYGKP